MTDVAGISSVKTVQENLSEFLAPGLIAEDIPPLFPLLAARPLIGALIALFRGGDDEVLIRLMVLREVGLRADAPEWTPRESASASVAIRPVILKPFLYWASYFDMALWHIPRFILDRHANRHQFRHHICFCRIHGLQAEGQV